MCVICVKSGCVLQVEAEVGGDKKSASIWRCCKAVTDCLTAAPIITASLMSDKAGMCN